MGVSVRQPIPPKLILSFFGTHIHACAFGNMKLIQPRVCHSCSASLWALARVSPDTLLISSYGSVLGSIARGKDLGTLVVLGSTDALDVLSLVSARLHNHPSSSLHKL